jgi:hypothetical protein
MKSFIDIFKFTFLFLIFIAAIIYFGPTVINSIDSKLVSIFQSPDGSSKIQTTEVENILGSTTDDGSPMTDPLPNSRDPVVAAETVPAQVRASQDPPLTSSASLPASQTVFPPQPRDPLLDVLKDSEKTAAVKNMTRVLIVVRRR